MKLVFATANRHKLDEIRAMLPTHLQIIGLSDLGFSGEIPETEPTLEGNALLKARYIHERYGISCFSDDTGLEVEALDGAPGVYSARYAGVEGTSDERAQANMEKLLYQLHGKSNRNARFRTVIAWIDPANMSHLFEGTVNGRIIEEATGNEGFGYDPIFIPDGYQITFAQMPLYEKNMISHRAKAFGNFAEMLISSVKLKDV